MVNEFLERAAQWVCDGSTLDVRAVAERRGDRHIVWNASVVVRPWSLGPDNSFRAEYGTIAAAQHQAISVSRSQALAVIDSACRGRIELLSAELTLAHANEFGHIQEARTAETSYSDLNLTVVAEPLRKLSPDEGATIDDRLRCGTPPFDGLSDLYVWLDFGVSFDPNRSSSIVVRIEPPVVLQLDQSSMSGGRLTLVLRAHPAFDVTQLGLAIRGWPGGIQQRIQVASSVEWADADVNARIGRLVVDMPETANALTVLTIGDRFVLRRWFTDPQRSVNRRFLSIQEFDSELRATRHAAFNATDAGLFEKSVGSLLYALGFSPVHPVDKDAPDFIVMTPQGRLVLVECTIKLTDIVGKSGKLAARKNALIRTMTLNRHDNDIAAFLITRDLREDIASMGQAAAGTYVLCREEIEAMFNLISVVQDADALVESWTHAFDAERTNVPAL